MAVWWQMHLLASSKTFCMVHWAKTTEAQSASDSISITACSGGTDNAIGWVKPQWEGLQINSLVLDKDREMMRVNDSLPDAGRYTNFDLCALGWIKLNCGGTRTHNLWITSPDISPMLYLLHYRASDSACLYLFNDSKTTVWTCEPGLRARPHVPKTFFFPPSSRLFATTRFHWKRPWTHLKFTKNGEDMDDAHKACVL